MTAAPAIADKEVPRNLDTLAFASVRELGELLKRKKATPVALTQMNLGRLKDYSAKLLRSSPRGTHNPAHGPSATEEEKTAYGRRKSTEAATMAAREYDREYDLAALEVFKKMGVQLIPVALPKFPYDAFRGLLDAESGAAFDWLTLTGCDKHWREMEIPGAQ